MLERVIICQRCRSLQRGQGVPSADTATSIVCVNVAAMSNPEWPLLLHVRLRSHHLLILRPSGVLVRHRRQICGVVCGAEALLVVEVAVLWLLREELLLIVL